MIRRPNPKSTRKSYKLQLQEIIEQAQKHIFIFFDAKELQILKLVSKVFYYNILTFQLWRDMMGQMESGSAPSESQEDVAQGKQLQKKVTFQLEDEKQEAEPVNVLSKAKKNKKTDQNGILKKNESVEALTSNPAMQNEPDSTQSNSLLTSSQNDPFYKTSYFKKNFFQNFDNQTLAQRPVSQAQSKRRPQLTEKTDNILWMKKLESLSQVTQVFDAKKSFKENCQVIQDLASQLDTWISELRKLEKILDAQSIITDSLVQEVSLWTDVMRVFEQYQGELNLEHVRRVEQLLQDQQKLVDPDVLRKFQTYQNLKKSISKDKDYLKQFASSYHSSCFEPFKNLVRCKASDLQFQLPPILAQILKLYRQFQPVYNLRIYFTMEKLYQLIVNKMKESQICINMIADVQNANFVQAVLTNFLDYLNQLLDAWKQICQMNVVKESSTYIHEKMFEKKIVQIQYVLKEIGKMKNILEKLQNQQKIYIKDAMSQNSQLLKEKINGIIKLYSETDLDFDIFVYENKPRWEDVIRFFKSRINEIKNFITNKMSSVPSNNPALLLSTLPEKLDANTSKQQKDEDESPSAAQIIYHGGLQWKIE